METSRRATAKEIEMIADYIIEHCRDEALERPFTNLDDGDDRYRQSIEIFDDKDQPFLGGAEVEVYRCFKSGIDNWGNSDYELIGLSLYLDSIFLWEIGEEGYELELADDAQKEVANIINEYWLPRVTA